MRFKECTDQINNILDKREKTVFKDSDNAAEGVSAAVKVKLMRVHPVPCLPKYMFHKQTADSNIQQEGENQ